MSSTIRYLFILVIFLTSNQVFSQRLGLLPSKTKWYQLQLDSLKVIFPEGEEENAGRVASLMLKIARFDPIAEDGRYKRISVLLQPRTNISNGYVGLAPYVSELFLQTNENPFTLGSLPWQDLLAIHEYRHVQQMNAANTGLSHLVKVVLGDLAFAGMYNLSVSSWLREGDAVNSETKWTSQGRGRLSSFTLPFREKMRRDGKTWNYYLVRNGSYRTAIPDHYTLGYLMVQQGNHSFGESIWDTIFRQAPRFKQPLEPLTGVVQKYYGKRNRHLYADALEWFGQKWKAEEEEEVTYPIIPIAEKDRRNAFFDMTYPSIDPDGNIFTAITSFDTIPAIYIIKPDGSRKRIVNLGLQQDTYFDWGKRKLVWTELRFDPRWVRIDKNVLVIYNLETGKKRSIFPDKGYYTPSLDATGNRIVVLHVDDHGQNNLQIIDANTLRTLQTLPNEENLYLGYPYFSDDGHYIIATARNDKGQMCLVEQSLQSGKIRQITHYSFSVLGRPVVHENWIYLAAGIGPLDQVYAVDRNDGIFYQISHGNSAHYDPVWDSVQKNLVCSEYHLEGKKLVRLPGDPSQWKAINLDDGKKYIEGLEGRDLLVEEAEKKIYDIEKYSPWMKAINLHSWVVTADDPVWGIELRSDNVLSTVSMAAGYRYNRNNNNGGPYFDVSMGMWFPVVSFGFSNLGQEYLATDGEEVRFSYDELYGGLTLPLSFTPGVFTQELQVSSYYHSGFGRTRPLPEGQSDSRFNYVSQRFVLINSRKRAYKQPIPSWAQRFEIDYAHEVTGVNISQWYLTSELAMPSIAPSNYLMVAGEYLSQAVDNDSRQLNSRYSGPRGFDIPDGGTNYNFAFTYGFPLWYPERGLGSILYVSRIRLQPFFDIAYTNSEHSLYSNLKSAGTEILLDFDINKITVGFRYARLLSGYEGNPNQFEFFIPSRRF